MARLTITLEDDGRGGVNVTTTNDTPEPEPSRWTTAHRAFYVASSALADVSHEQLLVDGVRTDADEVPQ